MFRHVPRALRPRAAGVLASVAGVRPRVATQSRDREGALSSLAIYRNSANRARYRLPGASGGSYRRAGCESPAVWPGDALQRSRTVAALSAVGGPAPIKVYIRICFIKRYLYCKQPFSLGWLGVL